MTEPEKLVIIGSGPAGYTAAIYAARANLNPLVFEGFFSGPAGGQLMTTTDIENYPGFPAGLTGPELMSAFREQAKRFGTRFVVEDVQECDLSKGPYTVQGAKTQVQAHAVIVATGATAQRLEIKGAGDNELWGKGVSACAICDGAMPIFRDKPLFVIGGGDSAMEEALFLTKYGSSVTVVHRRDQLRASKIMGERAMNHPKINFAWDSHVVKVEGNPTVESVTIQNIKTGKEEVYLAAGLFFAIGHTPNTAFLKGQLDLGDSGYIKLAQEGRTFTNVEGVFAAGDVYDHVYRQAITAAGSGCMAALDAERWLSERGLA